MPTEKTLTLRGLIIFACLVVVVVVGLLFLLRGGEEEDQALIDRLFTPYFTTIYHQDWQKAWSEFTTARYQKKNSLAKFTKHYQAVIKEYGPISQLEVLMTQGTKELTTGRSYNRVKLKIFFGKRFVIVWYEVVDVGGVYKIDGSTLSTQIIQYYGPW